jgi:hypothetical protein
MANEVTAPCNMVLTPLASSISSTESCAAEWLPSAMHYPCLPALIFLICLAIPVLSQQTMSIIEAFQTTWERAHLFSRLPSPNVQFGKPGSIGQADIVVQDSLKYQHMVGFGAALSESVLAICALVLMCAYSGFVCSSVVAIKGAFVHYIAHAACSSK